MTESVRTWLRSCPLIDQNDRFSINYLGAEPMEYTVEEVPGVPVLTKYMDGSTMRTASFVVASRSEYSADVLQNIANSGFWNQLETWVEDQDRQRKYPKLDDGRQARSIEITSSHYLYEVGANTARYQIQLQLTYYQKGARH